MIEFYSLEKQYYPDKHTHIAILKDLEDSFNNDIDNSIFSNIESCKVKEFKDNEGNVHKIAWTSEVDKMFKIMLADTKFRDNYFSEEIEKREEEIHYFKTKLENLQLKYEIRRYKYK